MAIIIQNESRKIALTADQSSSLSASYKDFLAKQTANVAPVNNGTNVDAVEQIVNASAPATPQGDVLITDAPVANQAPTPSESVNIFDTAPIANDPVVKPEEPKVEQTIVAPPVTEEVKTDNIQVQDEVQETKNNVPLNSDNIDGLKKQLLDECYDLQLHVQEYSVKLEEILEAFLKEINKLTENKVVEKQEEVSVAPTVENVVSAPVTQNNISAPTEVAVNPTPQPANKAIQTIPENVNIFDQGVNIFDQVPQTPSNGGQIKM